MPPLPHMPHFDPGKLADWTGGAWLAGAAPSIRGFCFDARRIQSGECFVALSGGPRDGHDFIPQAAKGGAVAAIVERPQALALPQLQVADSLTAMGAIAAAVRSLFAKPVVAVTGSCGKTSTKEMLRCLLGKARIHATAGNWNNRIGVPMTLFGLDGNEQDFAVIEAGINQPGEMAALGQMIRADLNVLTNIGDAHLELLGSREHIAAEKSLLTQYAVEGSPLIMPSAALRYRAYAAMADRAIVLLPEGEPEPTLSVRQIVRYEIVAQKPEQLRQEQTLRIGDQTYAIASPSLGIATNAALAIVAARELGVPESELRERIKVWRPSDDRGRIATVGGQTFYIDCYNANPSSMADALDAFVRSATPNVARFYILGAMNELGDQAAERHRAVGRRLQLRPEDRVAFIGPTSFTNAYQAGAFEAGADPAQIDCAETIEKIKSTVAPFRGAIFLKGSRSYQLEQLLPKALLRA
jgi:UDP-N-acetylmuramoyl-tripeptide--D-alanyl-D-alanine ligase